VVACGLGRRVPGSQTRSVVWNGVGDQILFQPADFHEITDAFDGLVSAEKVVATLWSAGRQQSEVVEPENSYVKIKPDVTEEQTRAGIILPEECRERAQRGMILDLGPGELRLFGPMAGTRRTCRDIMGVSENEPLVGRTCWWEGAKKSVQVEGSDPCLLVQAADLIMLEDP